MTKLPTAPTTKDPIRLRIVMFGPPGAGKATSARSLGARLSQPVISACLDDGRTRLFDWLEYEGGRHDGRAIRTQLVTVPGDDATKRRALLSTADAVLFVADTTGAGMAGAKGSIDELRTFAAGCADPPALVVQANKRDDPDARSLGDVRSTLDLGPDDPIIETVATDGDGVRQAFVYAVRVALKRLADGASPDSVARQATPAELEVFLTTPAPVPADETSVEAVEPVGPIEPVEPVEPVDAVEAVEPPPPRTPRTLHRVRIDDPETFRAGGAEVTGVAVVPLHRDVRATTVVETSADWSDLPPPPLAPRAVPPVPTKRGRRRRLRRDDG